jgi:hypothetical protein
MKRKSPICGVNDKEKLVDELNDMSFGLCLIPLKYTRNDD